MNPNEIHEYLTSMVRDGAGTIAAFVVGIIVGGYLCMRFWGEHLKKKVITAEAVQQNLQGQFDGLYRRLFEQEGALNEQKALAEALNHENSRLRKQTVDLETRVEVLEKERGDLAPELQSTRAALTNAQARGAALERNLAQINRHLSDSQLELRETKKDLQTAQAEVQQALDQQARLEREIAARDTHIVNLEQGADQLEAKLVEANDRAEELGAAAREQEEHAKEILSQQGRIWARLIRTDVPSFRPAQARRARIISVLNLKGGVGKTTLTLNLGATLAKQGRASVLLIDLDFQRSLSALCLTTADIKTLHQQHRALQHYFEDPSPGAARLQECVVPLTRVPGCAVVFNSDPFAGEGNLEHVESQMMARWIMSPAAADPRFHLRAALHDPLLAEKFDSILMDCPPRFSAGCVNALAASDYVIAPVILDWVSAMAVPRMLRELRQLRQGGVIPDLQVLGMVANRTSAATAADLVERERRVWDKLPKDAEQAWGIKTPFFKPMLRQLACFANAVNNLHEPEDSTVVANDPLVAAVFEDLAKELKTRIRNASGDPATVPAQSQGTSPGSGGSKKSP